VFELLVIFFPFLLLRSCNFPSSGENGERFDTCEELMRKMRNSDVKWKYSQAVRLEKYFREAVKLRNISKLHAFMTAEIESVKKSDFELIPKSTLDRWAGFDAERLYHLGPKRVESLYRFLDEHDLFHEAELDYSKSINVISEIRKKNFFSATDARFGNEHLRRMVGNYIMYRRFWPTVDKNTFMTSRVAIRESENGEVFSFRESQFWTKEDIDTAEDYSEVSYGYLFPSGQSILAICRSIGNETTKFLSICDITPVANKSDQKVQTFSGTGIASSDTPPHVGYGFHCKRETPLEVSAWRKPYANQRKSRLFGVASKRYQSKILTFAEMKIEKIDILQKIEHYEGLRS